jgi:hypothetical protein
VVDLAPTLFVDRYQGTVYSFRISWHTTNSSPTNARRPGPCFRTARRWRPPYRPRRPAQYVSRMAADRSKARATQLDDAAVLAHKTSPIKAFPVSYSIISFRQSMPMHNWTASALPFWVASAGAAGRAKKTSGHGGTGQKRILRINSFLCPRHSSVYYFFVAV